MGKNSTRCHGKSKFKRREKYWAWMLFIVVISMIVFFVLSYQEQKLSVKKNKVIEPEMVAIKGGCFLMGSPDSEKERKPNEKQHKICVENFELGKTEVTKGQFSVFVSATNYKTGAESDDGCFVWTGRTSENDVKYNWRNVGFIQTDEHPVVCVDWYDAIAYIDWLKKVTGKNYRLPTEAEWEYAARAGTTTPFYTGDCITTSPANYNGIVDYNNCGAKSDVSKRQTVMVGSYLPNPWGLLDMAGNAWEWTCSGFDSNYTGKEQQCVGLNEAVDSRVLRGGSWLNEASYSRSASRDGRMILYRHSYLSFRLALVS